MRERRGTAITALVGVTERESRRKEDFGTSYRQNQAIRDQHEQLSSTTFAYEVMMTRLKSIGTVTVTVR